eukprot:CAMPEP_0172312976 /NCGR_PEP_ID=MMETSP1058-20130122/18973_1 /TAXON_ID=83371 /ORGANISM="Detonula confervacea, Strain CCMP 353" /LENGTH=557 /DNA_ID=CAMNT_0013026545 /DNA_START=104 /DNA_END=1777 /DNA_ORIENTATION=+
MATISPAPAFAPSSSSESSSSVILPTTPTQTTTSSTYPNDGMLCDNVYSGMMHAADNDEHATAVSSHTTLDESTQGALDALAALASSSTAVSSTDQPHSYSSLLMQPQQIITPHQTSSDDDSEIMPPPPPRNPTTMMPSNTACASSSTAYPSFTFLHDSTPFHNLGSSSSIGGMGRLRSASNPEGMEKWDLYSQRNDRQHFVLPSSILEEELASTRRALGEIVDEDEYGAESGSGIGGLGFHNPQQEQQQSTPGSQQHWSSAGLRRSERTIARLGTSPDSVTDLGQEDNNPLTATAKSTSKSINNRPRSNSTPSKPRKKSAARSTPPEIISKSPPPSTDEEDEEVDESTLEPEELLRRARSRLLEDLSESSCDGGEGGLNGDNKGSMLILPHSLSKYKEVYNKNGRIGIYTPAERAAIIQKFNAKRARRMWKKKIRYNCRKNLADRRMRVKGRFVKRAVEAANSPPPTEENTSAGVAETNEEKGGVQFKMDEEGITAKARSRSPPTSGSTLTTVSEQEEQQQQPMEDEEMPDVNDDEAGFEPSEDMPYRRTRRYTIT